MGIIIGIFVTALTWKRGSVENHKVLVGASLFVIGKHTSSRKPKRFQGQPAIDPNGVSMFATVGHDGMRHA